MVAFVVGWLVAEVLALFVWTSRVGDGLSVIFLGPSTDVVRGSGVDEVALIAGTAGLALFGGELVTAESRTSVFKFWRLLVAVTDGAGLSPTVEALLGVGVLCVAMVVFGCSVVWGIARLTVDSELATVARDKGAGVLVPEVNTI